MIVSSTTAANGVWLSTNTGLSWNKQFSLPTSYTWNGLASNGIGNVLLANSGTVGGGVRLSYNGGITWSVAFSQSTSYTWTRGAAISSDGQQMIVAGSAVGGGGVWLSTNAGVSWFQQSSLTTSSAWSGVATNSSGTVLLANSSTVGYGVWLYKSNSPDPDPVVCFKEDTKILTDKGYILVQDLRKGDLVKTLLHDFKPICMIGKSDIYHGAQSERIKDQLYICKKSKYPELFEDLIVTGCHSILVDDFKEGEREKMLDLLEDIYITDGKYRLAACVDERASVYNNIGNHTIYHIVLENDFYYGNYGIYANGLLVESCDKYYMTELSNMKMIE
jgi:hypothetical protein